VHEEGDSVHPGLSGNDVDAVAAAGLSAEAAAQRKVTFLKLAGASAELTPDRIALHVLAGACDPSSEARPCSTKALQLVMYRGHSVVIAELHIILDRNRKQPEFDLMSSCL
jgi:hypothetical protein